MADITRGKIVSFSLDFPVTWNGTVTRGDPIYNDGTGWARADASSTRCMAFALTDGDTTNSAGRAAESIVVETSGLTAASWAYLSTTAGRYADAVPAEANAIAQTIGYAISTTLLRLSANMESKAPTHLTVVAKTADYTLTAADSGKMFTTTGASGTVNFTLPAVASSAGLVYWFQNTVNQTMTITSTTADKIVAFNDAAADSISYAGSSAKIGGGALAVCDGTNWLVLPLTYTDGTAAQTITIAT